MKAFISHSLNDSEEYILSILAWQLREQGFVPSSSYNDYSTDIDNSRWEISRSNLFIGIITSTGDANDRVFWEWRQAQQSHVPAILLVEDTVQITKELQSHPNVIKFNRLSPENSIKSVKRRISTSRNVPIAQSKADNTAAWILGGGVVLGLIGLLTTTEK